MFGNIYKFYLSSSKNIKKLIIFNIIKMLLNIKGKQYDLTNFNHPGGTEILELSKNEPDCTALFESYHAFCDMEKIKKQMKIYEVKDSKYDEMFSFENDGFYNIVKQKVISYFESKMNKKIQRNDIKANLNWILVSLCQVILFIYAQYQLLFSTFFLSRIIFGFISGFILVGIGFNVLHDSSHYALSVKPIINNLFSYITQSIVFWNHILWSYHHIIRHHQYTGMLEYDPDMRHSMPFLRKSSQFQIKPLTFSKKFLIIKLLLFNCIFPGSFIGQALSYHIVWIRKGKIWKMKLPDLYSFINSIGQYFISISFLSLMIYYAGFYTLFHLIGMNIMYFFSIAPDHDLFSSHLETENFDKNKKMDWGEQQVRASANFCTKSLFITRFAGGINYQIEHHLFPSLNNVYLSEIAPIVKQSCQEFNIPYNSIENPKDVFNELCKTYLDAYKNY